MKDAGIRIRVEEELRTAFRNACKKHHRAASDVLREFMRGYVERNPDGQPDLFEPRRTRKDD
jgi:hypothetical protein